MPAEFEPLQRGAAVVYGACDGLWVMTIFAAPTKADMLLARPALAAMTKREPAGFATLTWILPSAGFKMDSDARKSAADITKVYEKQILAIATLIEGTGFQAAAVRGIIAGMDSVSRGTKKVFSELSPAVEWCVPRRAPGTRGKATPAETTAALAAMRATLIPKS